MNKKNNFYAYKIIETNEIGILDNWNECKKKVSGKNAKYLKFKNKVDAEKWLDNGAQYLPKKKKKKINNKNIIIDDGIYFDAGTGRGRGVEVRVTDKEKNSLLNEILKEDKINEFENLELGVDVTNNYGELMGLYLSLNFGIKKNIKFIYGDSKLVIDYWSKGMIKKEMIDKTKKLAFKVKSLRDNFENNGGKIIYISGDINPADLGFHR